MLGVFLVKIGSGTSSKTVDLLTKHALIEDVQVKKHCNDLLASGDKWQKQNLAWSGMLMQNAVSPAMLAKMTTRCSIGDPGPVMFHAFCKSNMSDSYKTLDTLKKKVENMKVADFPNESLTACVNDLKPMLKRLDGAKMLDVELLTKIPTIFEDCSDAKVQSWASPYITKASEHRRLWVLCDRDDSLVPPSKKFDVWEFLQAVVEKHADLLENDRYGPAATMPKRSEAKEDLPQAFMAEIKNELDGLKAAISGGHDGSTVVRMRDGTPVKCHECGENHFKKDCPRLSGNSKGSGDGNGNPSNKPWRKVPPHDANCESKFAKNYKGRDYFWCCKCNNGNGIWTSHYTCDHRGAPGPGSKRAEANIALVDDSSNDSDSGFLSFGQL
jgi:hypothetical protein